MGKQGPKPLTGDELRSLRDRFGSDRLARLLLWEIARLRSVVMVLYQQICRHSYYRPNEPPTDMDEETETVIDAEPVITENAHASREIFKSGRERRYPHMSAEKEA